ncbi:MAG TPA: LuxR C-terminal-related transcriptional regulator [Sphingobium sp.]|uniref:LuxR C-terminal-related transcriptional regulator n=1 Tax=Sphingobium sp. TaxID=1912891 RepID=UPI002ED0D616
MEYHRRTEARRDVHSLAGDTTMAAHEGWASLSPRERQVAHLIGEGCTNKEAARVLQISPRTVETQRSAVMRKLSLRRVADLVRYVLRYGTPRD